MSHLKKAVVLSSGGLDSTTAMAIARYQGFEIYSLSFSYGQRHAFELEAAQKVADALGVNEHLVINIDLNKIGGSSLTDDIDVPKERDEQAMTREIPVTYVPARNTIFLSFALAWAEVLESSDIFIGINAVDYSGYPDCRSEYVDAFERMANLATKAGVEGITKIRIRTPLIHLTKAQIIQKGMELGVDYALTHSCYDPSPQGLACGECDSCFLRKKGFKEADVKDPTKYI
ncbi:MAG: 7-cyano-7-deazaguanine synthase QueC [Deltaproteobacteria bacterium]|nr:7-cyano-7-deazaguanine synthase QueC [Deltaproteobacteria bacterium]MBW1827216.1 7-cyano-7-deazaguanine synthase QueC [Deltaproteobacteria bacterium]MBW1970745.1 7-cyano-7-deazaguanine synthase QueC [Deltaproteobacteria bacterium]MBW2157832.1 7-cyano-7-deazaguanine synthase QueC [Deltaproteobacteria bacterium]MBW2198628.1 7-cyano-7-deazaguanine synthase QueC [Deltaproteobacteria bacterium]